MATNLKSDDSANKNDYYQSKIELSEIKNEIKVDREPFFVNNIEANKMNFASLIVEEVGGTENIYFLLQLSIEVTSQLVSTLNTAVNSGQFASQFSSNYGNTVSFTGQFTQSTMIGEPVS